MLLGTNTPVNVVPAAFVAEVAEFNPKAVDCAGPAPGGGEGESAGGALAVIESDEGSMYRSLSGKST